MKFIFCVISLTAIVCLNFVQADYEQELFDNLRDDECFNKTQICTDKIKHVGIKVTEADRRGLCDANPLTTTGTKCLMDCQMEDMNWTNDKGFQKDKYLEFIKKTSLGQDKEYVQAAEKVAELCKKKKASFTDSCETAYIVLKCLQDEGNKLQRLNLGYSLFYVAPFFLEFE
uniref:Odorant-binding protein 30 n=1 Tax=Bradysia odoriphaga TaxID=1564500 RepID=A0A2S0X9I5_9DIPT|nr:odorant-binding protein 30 [Bradysia odoriphaga]